MYGSRKVTDLDQYNSNRVKAKALGFVQVDVKGVQQIMKVTDLDQYNGNTVVDKARGVAQSALATVQGGVDLMQTGLARTQDTVQSGLEQTQDVLQSGLNKAQSVLSAGRKNVKRAGKGLQSATGSLKDAQESVQQQFARYAKRRRRAKVLFRMGLLTGVVLVLLYAPWPGSDTRRQLGKWWQQVYPGQGQPS